MQRESKSMEHARRNEFVTHYPTPMIVKHQQILAIVIQQLLIIKHQAPMILNHQTPILSDFATICPFPDRYIYIGDHLGLISLFPLMYYFTFMQATLIHLHNKTRSALVTHHYYCLGTSSDQSLMYRVVISQKLVLEKQRNFI